MPVEIGTATDAQDLLDLLVTFATANGWTELENTADKVVLQGEGAGSDEIIVAIQKYSDGWNLNGYTGYTPGLTFHNQPSALPSGVVDPVSPSMPLWSSAIPYWFIVNERRIIVVAKVSTTFQMCYLGWFLPYASPGQYAYPLFVGGSCGGQGGIRTGVADFNRAFWGAYTSAGVATDSGIVYAPGGSKYQLVQEFLPASNTTGHRFRGVFPYNTLWTAGSGIGTLASGGLGGEAVLIPLSLAIDELSYQGIIGDLDGMYYPTKLASAEDIINDGVDDYLVVPNVFRTTQSDLVAIRLT